MRVVHPLLERVEATEPTVRFGSEPELPPEPSIDEQRALQVELGTYGSLAIGDAYSNFIQKVRSFHLQRRRFG
jgi:hypothetical protein